MGTMDLVRAKDRGSAPACEDVDGDASESNKKCCVDCKTTKTPLWRSGPAGPKSLCNACGIRYRKRRVTLSSNKEPEKMEERALDDQDQTVNDQNGGSLAATDGSLSESVKLNLVALSAAKRRCRRRRKVEEEEEQAALCLLAMSCGYVFA